MDRLDNLTPKQADRLPAIRDEWLSVGLSTEPADRTRAEAGVAEAYRAAGLEPPAIVLWLDSPMAGAIGAQMLPEVLKTAGAQVGAQVWDQVGAQVWDQVGAQVGDQVWDQVRDQVRAQVGDQVWDQVRAQVGDQVRAQVGAQVGDQVWDQVRDQVRAQVWDQVGDQVRAQVGDQVWDQVWDQVRAQVGDQVRAQVGAQVGAQVRAQVGDQVWDQVRDQVGRAIWGQHDAWLSYYAPFVEFGIEAASRLHGLFEVAHSAGWWWPFRGAVILTDRPIDLYRDQQGRLHSESGVALRYRDGWGITAWHGVRCPDDFHSWDTARALTEKNSEVRRCAIERLGWDAVTDQLILVAEAPDPGNAPHMVRLYDLPKHLLDMYDEQARILVVHNASVDKGGHRRSFGLPVPATHKDPIAAAADLFGIPVAAYRGLVRAS